MSEAPGAEEETSSALCPGRKGNTRRLKSWIQLNAIAAASEFFVQICAQIPGLA